MTIPRQLVVVIAVVGSAFALLVFGNPQWHWKFYRIKVKINSILHGQRYGVVHLSPPSDYSGIWNRWNGNGVITSSKEFLDGQLHGKSEFFFPTDSTGRSQTQKIQHYQHGKAHGALRIFSVAGSLVEEAEYVNGTRIGIATEYDDRGRVAYQYEWINGSRRQLVSKYTENSHFRNIYEDDLMHPTWVDQYVFDDVGTLTEVIRTPGKANLDRGAEPVWILSSENGVDRRDEFGIPSE